MQGLLPAASPNRSIPCHREFAACIVRPATPASWIVSARKYGTCRLFAALASMLQKLFLTKDLHQAFFEVLLELCTQSVLSVLLSDLSFPLQWLRRYRSSRWISSQRSGEGW